MLTDDEIAWYAAAEKKGVLTQDEQAWWNAVKAKGLAGVSTTEKPAEKPAIPKYVRPEQAGAGIIRGIMDPIDAGAQLLEKAVPDVVSRNVNKFNNWLVDKGVPLDRIPEGGVTQQLKEQEKAYQARRASSGDTGADLDRLLGNLISPANMAPAAGASAIASRVAPQATKALMGTLGGRAAAGAAQGASLGLLQPVTTEGDYWEEKRKQAAIGGVTGGAVPLIGSALSRVVKPKSSDAVRMLQREGVPVTPGDALGGLAQRIEHGSTVLPLTGDAIMDAQNRAFGEFNKGAVNHSLRIVGEKLPADVKPGFDSIKYASDTLSGKYKELLPKLSGQLDNVWQRDMANLNRLTKSMPQKYASEFDRIIKNEVIDKFTIAGKANGFTLKEVEANLGEIAKNYSSSKYYDETKLGKAILEAQSTLRKMIDRQNPKHRGDLRRLNDAWGTFKIVEKAAASQGAKEGVFTPLMLKSSARAQDITKDRRAFSIGEARLQKYAEAGDKVLSRKIPDSGTAFRQMINTIGVTGAAAVHPPSLAYGVAGAAAYQKPGVAAMTGLLTGNSPVRGTGFLDRVTGTVTNRANSKAAQTLADLLRRQSLLANPAAVPYANSLLSDQSEYQ